MTEFKVVCECGTTKDFDSRSKAEEGVDTHEALCQECEKGSAEIKPKNGAETDGGTETVSPNVVDHSGSSEDDGEDETEVVEATTEELPETSDENNLSGVFNSSEALEDPLDTLPGWMISQVSFSDRGDSTTTVNKRGCQVIASYLGLESKTEATTPAAEADFEYACYSATVTKPDGREFTGHGTARADGDDQDESEGWKLDMMAETRAYKRAVKSATGGGIEAFAKEQSQ